MRKRKKVLSDKITPCLDLLASRVTFSRQKEGFRWSTSEKEDIVCEREHAFQIPQSPFEFSPLLMSYVSWSVFYVPFQSHAYQQCMRLK